MRWCLCRKQPAIARSTGTHLHYPHSEYARMTPCSLVHCLRDPTQTAFRLSAMFPLYSHLCCHYPMFYMSTLLLSLLPSLCTLLHYLLFSFLIFCLFKSSFLPYHIRQWSSTWGTRVPRGARTHLTSLKPKHRNRLHLEPALILTLTKIRPRTEEPACQRREQAVLTSILTCSNVTCSTHRL
jgi:hypothetical protein